jgi:bifunctional DNA-binding transcriptional regulator/antitoxin component of YhaV-PrlF toxin-antitoxin module
MWDVGVGETVNLDEKGRIIIPAKIRKVIGRRTFSVEIADKDTIILRATGDRRDLAKRIEDIHLTGDKSRASTDFSEVKDLYGGRRVETN